MRTCSTKTESFVRDCKEIVEHQGLQALQEFFYEYVDDSDLAWEFILLKVYIHACLLKKKEIAEWIADQCVHLDPIQQIAIRQMFPYGRWLLAR